MFAAKQFQNAAYFTRRDAIYTFDKFHHLINWRKDKKDSLIDIGCASGDLIQTIILPNLPSKSCKVVGIDISKEMIDFARKHVQSPMVTFAEIDISKRLSDKLYIESFDHLTAFNLLHWIRDSRQNITIDNFYKLLRKDGDCIITTFISHQGHTTHLQLENHSKWAKYMGNPKDCVSAYHFVNNPKEMLENYLKSSGFSYYEVHLMKTCYPLFIDTLKDLTYATSPFIRKIPVKDQDEYVNDFIKIWQQNAPAKPKHMQHFDIVSQYTWLRAYARK